MESAGTMSKHNSLSVSDEDKIVSGNSNPLEDTQVRATKTAVSKRKTVVLMVNAKYKITGKYSRQAYFFDGAGSRQEVDEIDVDWMVSLSRGNVCCGGGTRGTIFALAEV